MSVFLHMEGADANETTEGGSGDQREQREQLQEWTRRGKTAQALALRARIVLYCAESRPDGDVAEQLGVTRQTVDRWRRRFVESGVDGLLDEPRPGAPRQISGALVETVIALTLESQPKDAMRTGWRKGEGLGLQWRSVDFACGTIRIEETKCGAEDPAVPRLTRAGRTAPGSSRADEGP